MRRLVPLAVVVAVIVAVPAHAAAAAGAGDIAVASSKQLTPAPHRADPQDAGARRPGARPRPAARGLRPEGQDALPGALPAPRLVRHRASWTDKGDAEAITNGMPVIVVMPAMSGKGDAGGWASNWRNGGKGGPPRVGDVPHGRADPVGRRDLQDRRRARGTRDRGTLDGRLRRAVLRRAPPRPVRGRRELLRRGRHEQRGRPGSRRARDARRRRRPGRHLGAVRDRRRLLARPQPARPRRQPARHDALDPNRQRRARALRPARPARRDRDRRRRELEGPPRPPRRARRPARLRRLRAGTHSWPYWQQDLRRELPRMLATFKRRPKPPATVTYASIEPAYDVFGWHVAVARKATELSQLADASKTGFACAGAARRRSPPPRCTARARATASRSRRPAGVAPPPRRPTGPDACASSSPSAQATPASSSAPARRPRSSRQQSAQTKGQSPDLHRR